MSSAPTPAQVLQWSEEVARDPGTLAFLPLARVYRDAGRRNAALRLCLRGLERHPTNVEAHYLLGLLYREGGETVKAFDEWDMALSLDPEHVGARREIGLFCAERGEWGSALRHLELAAAADPGDHQVGEALARIRAGTGSRTPVPAPEAAPGPAPAAPAPDPPAVPAPAPAAGGAGRPASRWETAQGEFRALVEERGVVGALLLDGQGLVVAGEMRVDGSDRAPEVAAALHGASGEAERALRHLGLGRWQGMLVETAEAVVRIAPVEDSLLAVAARREVPTGWVLRVAARARGVAERLLRPAGGSP
ncbi:MAG TPA: roadblock/LC7 domain-containing protein [Longimicrobiaceae bacterium]|nr:roadblock/LC7 domain-containing protein [Longimicrobiaceae bacterium]